MNLELEQKLWNAGIAEEEYSREIWYKIIDALLDDFRDFIGQDFHRDPKIDLVTGNPCPSFSRWIWTGKEGKFPISVTWSAFISGDIVDGFDVGIPLFMFDTTGDKRLQLKTGESYLYFTYRKQSNGRGNWRSLGWFKDEWGQWEDL